MRKQFFKYLLCVFINGLMTATHAQQNLVIGEGLKMFTSGNISLVFGPGKISNNGTISGSSGTWVLKGPTIIEGKGNSQLYNLVIDHSTGVTQLNMPVSILHNCDFVSGVVQTNNNLFIRTDLNSDASLIVSGIPFGNIHGLMTRSTIVAGPCPSFRPELSVNISGAQLRYQWQGSADSISWNNIAGATDSVFTPVVNGPAYFRCNIMAGPNNLYNDTARAIKLMLDIPDAGFSKLTAMRIGDSLSPIPVTAGGAWGTSNPAVLTVDPITGKLKAISAGTALIAYVITNGSGCSASTMQEVTVVVPGNKPALIVHNPPAVCAPLTVDLTASSITDGSDPGLTYSYYTDPAGTNALPIPNAVAVGGTYYVKATNGFGVASDILPVQVTINPLPSGLITALQGTTLCGTAAAVDLFANGGLRYEWSRDGSVISGFSGATLSVNAPGIYTTLISTAAGCSAPASNAITITAIQAPKAGFDFDSYCINKPVRFNSNAVAAGTGTISYQWTDNVGNTSSLASPSFTYSQAGNYSVKLKLVSQECPLLADSIVQSIRIEIPAAAVRVQPATNAIINEPVMVQARTFGKAYAWTPSTGLSDPSLQNPYAKLLVDQQYLVAITAASGCVTVDTALVRVYNQRIYVPNVFTPNDDGINDRLFINIAGIRQLRYFRIYNRYGKLVFETNDPTVGWDGKFNNEKQPIDTYTYIVEVLDGYGAITIKRGNVTLLR